MESKDRKILRLLEKNAKFTPEDIADIIGESAEYVSARISELEADGIIRGYKSVIDWE